MSRPPTKAAYGVPSRPRQNVGGKSAGPISSKAKTQTKSAAAPKKGGFNIPALSIPPKPPSANPFLERLKRKTIRRNPPQNEDVKKIRDVIRGLQSEPVTVQEFVGLVSPYTGDNGNVLRTVMGEDLSSFRKMATRVYDTMTQDVSDVLANEQINLTDHYKERCTLYTDKMMRAISEIHKYAANFDFDPYFENPQTYLAQLFPIHTEELDPEEEEMQNRQAAYHRLQWLRSEGARLNDENTRLQGRLKQLKQQQKEALLTVRQQEEMADLKKAQLEAAEADLHNRLQDLNKSVEKSLICTEEKLRIAADSDLKGRASRRQMQRTARVKQEGQSREPWSVQTAKRIEAENLVKATRSAVSGISVASAQSKPGLRLKRMQTKHIIRKPPAQSRDTSPFHYSPPKSPPPPPAMETVSVESIVTHTEMVAPQTRQLPPARRNRAPADSWGGF